MQLSSSLLINESPLQVLPSLAVLVGLNEAIVLQQTHYWIKNDKVGKVIKGKKWVYNSIKEWQENFPFWSESTIKRAFAHLKELGVIVTEQFNKHDWDSVNYYSIDYEKLESLIKSIQKEEVLDEQLVQNEPSDSSNLNQLSNTETTPEINKEHSQISDEEWLAKKKLKLEGVARALEANEKKRLGMEDLLDWHELPERCWLYAEAFIVATNRKGRFKNNTERGYWIEEIDHWIFNGITPDVIKTSVKYMREEGLIISSPKSVTNIAISKKSEPNIQYRGATEIW